MRAVPFHRIAPASAVLALLAAPAAAQFQDVSSRMPARTETTLGIAWADIDGDGDHDVFLTTYGNTPGNDRNTLLENQGSRFVVRSAPELEGVGTLSTGAAWGDYDDDGDPDLFVGSESPEAVSLFRNDGTAGFTDVTPPVFRTRSLVYAATWIDYDQDGDLDLGFASRNGGALFRNDGDGSFADRTAGPLGALAWGLKWQDWDADGDPDAFVGTAQAPILLVRNDGEGRFREIAEGSLGRRLTDGAFSGDFADYDRDGDPDLYVTYFFGAARLFRNDGANGFGEATPPLLDGTGASYAGVWGDYDLDGDPDILRCSFQSGSTALYRNEPVDFIDVSPLLGRSVQDTVWSGVWGDWNGDGREDLYLGYDGAVPDRLLQNSGGGSRHWLTVRLVGKLSNRTGIGARVTAITGTRRNSREISGGGDGWCSQRPPVANFGLGGFTVADVEVVWPSGQRQTILGVAADQEFVVEEPGLQPVSTTMPAGQAFDFNIELAGSAVTEATLHVRLAASTDDFVPLALRTIGGRILRARIPEEMATPRGLEYWIEYRLNGGTPRRAPFEGVIQVTAEFADLAAPEEIPARRFALFGFPFVPEDGSLAGALVDDAGPVDPEVWKVGRWDADAGRYRGVTDSTLALRTGEAFWIIGTQPIRPSASGKSADVDAGVPIALRPGWNQVAHPFLFPVSIADVDFQGAPSVERRIVAYRGGGYTDAARLEPWDGYWMYNASNAGQTIRIPAVPAAEDSPPPPVRAPDGWRIGLSVRQGEARDEGNLAGTARPARPEAGAEDRGEPPPVPGQVRAWFDAVRDDGRPRELTEDVRPAGAGDVWSFVVDSEDPSAVRLSVSGVRDLPSGWVAWLVPEETSAVLELADHTVLDLPGGRTHRFRLVLGSRAFAEERRATGFAAAPRLQLGLPWPNPFRDETRLVFSVPRPGPVTVSVHDVAGRRIRTLLHGQTVAGRQELNWDGGDDAGRLLPSGVYLLRLATPEGEASRKVLLRR